MIRIGRMGAAILNARRQYLVYASPSIRGQATIITSMIKMAMSNTFQTLPTNGAGVSMSPCAMIFMMKSTKKNPQTA